MTLLHAHSFIVVVFHGRAPARIGTRRGLLHRYIDNLIRGVGSQSHAEMSSADESSESCSSSGQVGTASEADSTSSEDCEPACANRCSASAAGRGKTLLLDASGESETTWSVAASTDWVKHVGDVSPLQRLRAIKILLPCAGWDAPSQALHALGIKHTMVGAWETSSSAAAVLKRMHNGAAAKQLHLGAGGDICQVSLEDLPDADCLISGPPCPPFSNIGSRGSWNDPRSHPFKAVLRWIFHLANKTLVCFILENVKGMLNQTAGCKSPAAQVVAKLQQRLPKWHVEILTCDSRCTAQSRKRIYIVGYKMTDAAATPNMLRDRLPVLPPLSLEDIMMHGLPNALPSSLSPRERGNLNKYMKLLRKDRLTHKMRGRIAVLSIDRDPEKLFACQVRKDGFAPCLRASHHRVFLVSFGKKHPEVSRLLHPAEACLLQGMHPRIVPPGMTRAQIFRGCGNAMTVPVVGAVLVAVLREALPAMQLADSGQSSSSRYSDDSSSSDGSASAG